MKSTPEERIAAKARSRTSKIKKLINGLDVLAKGTRITIAEIDQAIAENRHVLNSVVTLKVNAIRRAN